MGRYASIGRLYTHTLEDSPHPKKKQIITVVCQNTSKENDSECSSRPSFIEIEGAPKKSLFLDCPGAQFV